MTSTTTAILGGGFGGISAANTLRQLLPAEHEIIVVDRSPYFHVGAGKTWIMLGEKTYGEISRQRSDLLGSGVRYVQESVLGLDTAGHTAVLESDMLRWDYLVIALGAEPNLTAVPGLAEAAHTFYTAEGARRLGEALAGFSSGDIVILIPKLPFPCPPAPYEAAMLLAHFFATRGLGGNVRIAIHTVEPAPMPAAGPEMGGYVTGLLEERGIGFSPLSMSRQVDAGAGRILFEDGSEVPYDLLIAIPPHEAPKPVRDAQLVNQAGWIPVDPATLQVKGDLDAGGVYAVGDITAVPLPGRYKPDVALSLPKAGVFAEAHGRVAAQQIAARILGKTQGEAFDGRGYCYLELGGGRAVKADGSFFDMPHPVIEKRSPDEAQFREKLDWVARHLEPLRSRPRIPL